MIEDPEETFRISSLLDIADRGPGNFLPGLSMPLRIAAGKRAVEQADPDELCSILQTNSPDFVIKAAGDKLVSMLESPSETSFITESLFALASGPAFGERVRTAAGLRAVLDTEDLPTLSRAADSQDLPQKVRVSAQRRMAELQKPAEVARKMGEGLRSAGSHPPRKMKR